MPVMAAVRSRRNRDTDCRVASALGFDGASCAVEAGGPRHTLDEFLTGDELAGKAIQDVEKAILRRLHENLAGAPIDLQVGQDNGLHRREIPCLARDLLEVPDHLPGIGLYRDDRGEKEIIAPAR